MNEDNLIARGNALMRAVQAASTNHRVIAKLRGKFFKNKTLPYSIFDGGYSRPGDPENNLPNGLLGIPINLDSREPYYGREERPYV